MRITHRDAMLLIANQEKILAEIAEQKKSLDRIEELLGVVLANHLLEQVEEAVSPLKSTRDDFIKRILQILNDVQRKKTHEMYRKKTLPHAELL